MKIKYLLNFWEKRKGQKILFKLFLQIFTEAARSFFKFLLKSL